MKKLLLAGLLSGVLQADPWPIGRDQGYAALVYGRSIYDGAYFGNTQTSFGSLGINQHITNESATLYGYYGIGKNTTLLVEVQRHSISSFEGFGAPGFDGFSDSYVGLKRTYRQGRDTRAWEFGVKMSEDYNAGLVTAPGYGSQELRVAWHWAYQLNYRDSLGFTAAWNLRNNLKDYLEASLSYSRQFDARTGGNVFVSFADVVGGNVDIGGPGFTAPPTTNFDWQDERLIHAGLGFSRRLQKGLDLLGSFAWKVHGENTDNAPYSFTVGLGHSF